MAKVTYLELLKLAGSSNSTHRKLAFEAYQAWKKAEPKLKPDQRLNAVQRSVLEQMFASKERR
jgi:hypothetical protein